jgi:two-component sensor histidine kinase
MGGLTAGERAQGTLGARVARMPTGAKIFIILSVALLPFAVIAFFATLSTTRQAGQEAASQLRVAAQESSHNLSIELVGDMTALTSAMKALAIDHGDTPSCARVQGVFAQPSTTGAGFMIVDGQNRLLCGSRLPVAMPEQMRATGSTSRIVPGKGIVLAIAAPGGQVRGAAFFPAAFLSEIAKPTGFAFDYEESLSSPGSSDRLVLRSLDGGSPLDLYVPVGAALGIGDLSIEMRMRTKVLTSPILIALIFPILMWVAAAGFAWFVVDRLLIKPLRTLRASVAAYRPGEVIDPAVVRSLPAQEIRELGETFRSLSRTLILHEAGLAEGLVRQTRLTREVHHRVKNNLQVISSLINLHARGAQAAEAARAYASIQRRVDALAVVHRHHFAEMEDNRGLSLRSVIGELASNIRATSPEQSELSILLDVEPWLVTQDVAIAIAFLLTEIIELAISVIANAQIHISVRQGETPGTAILRVTSPSLVDGDALVGALGQRYARVIEGLSRQLRAPLHHDPLTGSYEIAVAVMGRD